MILIKALQKGFKNYANFNGRAAPSEYWWFSLAMTILYILPFLLVKAAPAVTLILLLLILLASIIPSLAIAVRRLHDSNRSGAWYFVSFVPFIGGLWLLVLLIQKGTPSGNNFGDQPLPLRAQI